MCELEELNCNIFLKFNQPAFSISYLNETITKYNNKLFFKYMFEISISTKDS